MENRRSIFRAVPWRAVAAVAACLLLSLFFSVLACRLYEKSPADGILSFLCREEEIAVFLVPHDH